MTSPRSTKWERWPRSKLTSVTMRSRNCGSTALHLHRHPPVSQLRCSFNRSLNRFCLNSLNESRWNLFTNYKSADVLPLISLRNILRNVSRERYTIVITSLNLFSGELYALETISKLGNLMLEICWNSNDDIKLLKSLVFGTICDRYRIRV